MLFSNPTDILLPTPVHLLLLFIVLTVVAFRAVPANGIRRWRFLLLIASAWCWLVATPAFAHWLGVQLESQYPPHTGELPQNPVIVILAAGDAYERSLPDGLQLNLAAHRRTVTAMEVWHRTGGSLLVTGTTHSRERKAVAERMRRLAIRLGVPPERIAVETKSLNTRQNLEHAKALLDPERQLILVTSAMHMPRAMAVAHALGLQPLAVPADFRAKPELTWRAWLPNTRSQPLLGMVLHEWLGILYYRLRGWA